MRNLKSLSGRFFAPVSILLISLSASLSGRCLKISCDPTISYAMGQELAVITRRMGHLNNAMNSLARDTEMQTKILLKENIEWMRLRARMRIRTYGHMKENFNLSRLKRLEALNVDTESIRVSTERLIKSINKRRRAN